METITYKGYIGEYQRYNDGDNSSSYFAGSIPAVEHYAKVLFEGENMEELVEDFHNAVNDCIANEYVIQEKTHRITIPDSLYSILFNKAKKEGVSVSRYVRHALASVAL